MLKILVLILVLVIVYLIFFKKKKSDKNQKIENLVECKKCKTYISSEEALIKDNNFFCSKECLNGLDKS